jgi:Spy/CpxP family protein refolding chaperone
LIINPVFSFAQGEHMPYAGQEKREIKALSSEDIQGYLTGQGMGFAKAAELNHYPGPRHVLDMADELSLSEEQKAKTNKIFNDMKTKAVSLGRLIIDKERNLNNLFANQHANQTELKTLVLEIAKLQGELRFVHLNAHLEMKGLLSGEQIQKYDELRGYGGAEGKGHHQHHSGKHPQKEKGRQKA